LSQLLPQWFTDTLLVLFLALLVLLLVRFALKILGDELHSFVAAIKTEVKDFRRWRMTAGGLNMSGFVTLAIFGVIVIVTISSQKVLAFLAKFIGQQKAEYLSDSSSYILLIFVLAIVLVVSLVVVVIDNRRLPTNGGE
jgi:hypothetical protein